MTKCTEKFRTSAGFLFQGRELLSYENAEKYCSEKGAKLAAINTKTVLDELKDYRCISRGSTVATKLNPVLIGLRTTNGNGKWSDGAQHSHGYLNSLFAHNQEPKDGCQEVIYYNGELRAERCEGNRNFLCQSHEFDFGSAKFLAPVLVGLALMILLYFGWSQHKKRRRRVREDTIREMYKEEEEMQEEGFNTFGETEMRRLSNSQGRYSGVYSVSMDMNDENFVLDHNNTSMLEPISNERKYYAGESVGSSTDYGPINNGSINDSLIDDCSDFPENTSVSCSNVYRERITKVSNGNKSFLRGPIEGPQKGALLKKGSVHRSVVGPSDRSIRLAREELKLDQSQKENRTNRMEPKVKSPGDDDSQSLTYSDISYDGSSTSVKKEDDRKNGDRRGGTLKGK